MTALAYSAFSFTDTIITHWGSDTTKATWEAATLHFPFGLQTWLIGILLIVLVLVYDGSYRNTRKLEKEKVALLWADNRPILLFDSWGEIPHDHPEARFHEAAPPYRPEREYFERGFFLSNQGGTAHEITLLPIHLTDNVRVLGSRVTPRIDRNSKGFVFAWMDTEQNAKFDGDSERWDLAKVMATLETKINSTRVEEWPLAAEVGVCYRDMRGIWFVSFSRMTYRKDLGRIVFGPSEQMRGTFPSKEKIYEALTN